MLCFVCVWALSMFCCFSCYVCLWKYTIKSKCLCFRIHLSTKCNLFVCVCVCRVLWASSRTWWSWRTSWKTFRDGWRMRYRLVSLREAVCWPLLSWRVFWPGTLLQGYALHRCLVLPLGRAQEYLQHKIMPFPTLKPPSETT